jgi:hypothetical protein
MEQRIAKSQIDHSSIVVEELATVARNLHGNAIGVLDILLPQLLEHAAETIVPSLLFLGCFAGVCGAELHEELVAYFWFPKSVGVYQPWAGGWKENTSLVEDAQRKHRL